VKKSFQSPNGIASRPFMVSLTNSHWMISASQKKTALCGFCAHILNYPLHLFFRPKYWLMC